MSRLEILTEAVAQAWKTGQPDGLLVRELLAEWDKVFGS